VRQLQGRDEVADRADRRDRGLAVGVDLDEAPLHLDADQLVAQSLGHRPAADRDEQQLGLDGLAPLEVYDDAGGGVLHLGEAGPELLLDAALAEGALEQLGGRLLLQRDQVRQRLDDRDVRAERGPDGGELAADGPGAQDHHGGGDRVELQGVVGGDDPDAVELQAWE